MLGSGRKYRLSLAEMFDCTENITNQLLADSYQNPLSEWQVTIKPYLVAGYKAIPPHPLVHRKIVFHEMVPGAKKVGNHCAELLKTLPYYLYSLWLFLLP